jgi:light-regulated signal transduction histidine kinase (bacteriophytochrome)
MGPVAKKNVTEREPESVTVLLIDESDEDIASINQMLSGEKFIVKVARDLDMGLSLVNKGIDLIVLDLYLPYSQGYDTFEVVSDYSANIPIIVLTKNQDNDLALKAMRYGAQDYLFKETINAEVLVRSIRYAIERKKLVEEQKSIKFGLIEYGADIERFAFVAAHDLEQPLEAVIGNLQLLRPDHARGSLDKNAEENISLALDGASRMRELITDLLEYSRIGLEGRPVKPVDMEEVLTDVLREQGPSIDRAGVTVTHDLLPTIPGDRTQMTLLLRKLLDNVIRFRGTSPPMVHITAHEERKDWSFSVKCNGITMPERFQDMVSGKFERLFAPSAAGDYPGAGIDLIISKRIVERHGGSLWVDSMEGRKTTYHFTIPKEHP